MELLMNNEHLFNKYSMVENHVKKLEQMIKGWN